MKRTYANLLVAVALLCGVGLATAGLIQSESSQLPAAPTAATPVAPAVANTDSENGVVDMNDWQRTRIILGKASNPRPR